MGYKAFDTFYSLAGNRSGYRFLFCGIFCTNVPVPILCKAVIDFRRTCTYGVAFAHFLYWTIDTLKQYNWRAAARYFFREPVREKSSKKPLGITIKRKKQHQRIDKWGQGLTC